MGIQTGWLLIADISGYTAFLHDSELEHAQGILTQLLKLLLDHTRAPLIVSRTAGDAVISYAVGDPFVQSQTFVDRLEATYGDFMEAIDRMVLNNKCTCSACANVGSLDLKFFVHHGTFGVQDLGGHDELVGSDVNLLHRLLKNTVVETTGLSAYALYTSAAIERLRLDGWTDRLIAHTEAYEHLGEVQVFVQNLAPIAEAARSARSQRIPEDETRLETVIEVSAPVPLVWDALNDPEHRRVLVDGTSMSRAPKGGRMGPEAKFICYHGDILTHQEVLVYEPLHRMITLDHVHTPMGVFSVTSEYELQALPQGTRVIERFSRHIRASWYLWPFAHAMWWAMVRPARPRLMAAFKEMIEGRTEVVQAA